MKKLTKLFMAALVGLSSSLSATAVGWPAGYEGVLLQGFYWESFTDSRWVTLTEQADELSKSFSLIWVPQSGNCLHKSMGYDPVYWFKQEGTFGNQEELRTMIKTFKEKGTGIIADVVVNHRNGVSNWTNFPTEVYNGKTYRMGPAHICCNDEVANEPGQAKPTGAYDTGENFVGARDLDHTHPQVQENIKDYLTFLHDDIGYTGFRYDMVKGFGGSYVGIYNKHAKPSFSVGELWDGYDRITTWINETGKESAAFDFPFKYAVKEAFSTGDMTKLVWKAYGTTDQPAGLIHADYAQYSVTFIDNHDTARDHNAFSGNVVAANAFMICSPGTPCVFLKHWQEHKSAIARLIEIRNAVGVSNTSKVKVLKSSRSCYMAEVTGSKGTLVVKIGSESASPAGYTASDIKASGNDYCVWSKLGTIPGGGEDPETPVTPPATDPKTIYFDNSATSWTNPYIHYWSSNISSTWPGVKMTLAQGNVWKYDIPAEATGILFNAGDGDATKTADFAAVHNHIYDKSGDKGAYSGGSGGGENPNPDPTPSVNIPAALYVLGNLKQGSWITTTGVKMTRSGNTYTADNVELVDAAATDPTSYFTFVTNLGADWNEVNSYDRYGAAAADSPVTLGTPVKMAAYLAGVNASAALSWKTSPAKYTMVADFEKMTLTLSDKPSSGVQEINAELDSEEQAQYFNLQGMEVKNLTPGLYIRRSAKGISKVLVK